MTRPDPCDLWHDSLEDCSDARVPTATELEVLTLLGWAGSRELVRLTCAQWGVVARVERALLQRQAG